MLLNNTFMTNCHVLIPSGGAGQRFGGGIPKQYQLINGRAIVNYSLDVFINHSEISSVWVGISTNISPEISTQISWPVSEKLHIEMSGGDTRHATVLNTLELMIAAGIPKDDWVLVHDAARPGISQFQVNNLIQIVKARSSEVAGGILALPVADSLKHEVKGASSLNLIAGGSNREGLWQAQTPQMFRVGDLKDALQAAINDGASVTDEASAFERLGKKILLVQGSLRNFKVTYPDDLSIATQLLRQTDSKEIEVNSLRIGQGYDVHQLVEGRPLILGGILIPFEKGLLGHSDADALLHALTDALLGAAGLGDIGRHFPDTDPKYKGADSKVLLLNAYELVCKAGFKLSNMDATIICQKPKLSEYINPMIEVISKVLQVSQSQINIKAKTNEGLGYLGRQEAIAVEVSVLLTNN